MTKFILTLAALAIVTLSYAQNSYTISGTVPNSEANGKKIYLRTFEENYRTLTTIDSTVVNNNSFAFKGNAKDVPHFAVVALAEPIGKLHQALFVLEKGKIALTVDTVSFMKGTPNNDTYQTFATTAEKAYKEGGVEKYKQIAFDYAKNNIHLPTGEFYFLTSTYIFTAAQTRELLNATTDAFKEKEIYKALDIRTTTLEETAEGKPYIDIKGMNTEGTEIAFSDYVGKNKYVLIDFWASWCGPCRKEMPSIVAAYTKHKDKGFEIVGVSLDGDRESWVKALEQMNMTWPQMSDLKGWKSELSAPYAISSIPATIIIDSKGTIIARGLYGEELLKKLDELFK